MRIKLLLFTLLLSLSLTLPVAAQSGGYQVEADTYGAATGGTLTGVSYQVQGALGQPAVDTSAGGAYAVTGGIWAGAVAADVLVLTKEARVNDVSVNRAEVGAPLTYILAVTNNGLRAQEYVTVTDDLPVGLSLVPGSVASKWGAFVATGESPYRVTWTIPTLPANEIAVLTYQAIPLTDTEGLTLTNTAVGLSAQDGPVTATASVWVYRPHRLYLPVLMRSYPAATPPAPAPVVHPLADAPAQCLGATGVTVGDIYQDDFGTANDNDWYQFVVSAAGNYAVTTSDLGARADTLLALYAAGDCVTPIAENDDISYPANTASQVTRALTPGTYYALVRNWDWQVYGADTGYHFTVTANAPVRQMAPVGTTYPKPAPPSTPTPGGVQ